MRELWESPDLFGSHLVEYEAANTKDDTRRQSLIVEFKALRPVSKDQKLLGFNTVFDQYGGFVCSPMISDVQDESLREELMHRGLAQRDAEHVTQAICNDCDVFLTRDEKSIIKPHRAWLEERFPGFKVRLPSELLEELRAMVPAKSE